MASGRIRLVVVAIVAVIFIGGCVGAGSYLHRQQQAEKAKQVRQAKIATEVAAHEAKRREVVSELRTLPAIAVKVKAPPIENPQWLTAKLAAEAAAARPLQSRTPSAGRIFSYKVEAWGALSTSLAEFKVQASETLNSSSGWARTGIRFVEATSGGDLVLVISEAAEIERRYSPGCSAEYSCRVGQFVIINQDRWMGATPSWNGAGGSLRDYRHMVINHEVGHWLGHGHESCSGAGQLAPVMQQQSIDLEGCAFNPWPLGGELWIGR